MSSSRFSSSLPNSDDEKSPPHSPTATATATATATGTSTAKPDFSVITQTIGRQIHNVASFLAPPPQRPYSPSPPPPHTDDSGDLSPSSSSYQGMKKDLAEISGSFKTGLSLLSPKKAVTGISKFASNLLQFDKEDVDVDVDAVGITDAVLDLITEVSNRPECWIDFPLSLQYKEFSMSRVQKGHVLAMLQLIPNLTTLRHKIQDYMSEEQFWMIYFILLLPRLNEQDYRKLSTPEIIQVREELLEKLRNNRKPATGSSEDSQVNSSKQTENPLQDIKSLSETGNARNRIKDGNHPEYVVSFSDVEDEDNDDVSGRDKETESSNHSSASETSDWVNLSETSRANRSSSYRARHSESEESSDWHAVEDVDL